MLNLHSIRLVAGSSLFFCLDGTVISNQDGRTVSGSAVKPDGTTSGDWTGFGTVETVELKVIEEIEEIMAPAPGPYRRVNQLRSSQMTRLDIVIQEVNELVLLSLLHSTTVSDAIPSLAGTPTGELRGWFRLLCHSQCNAPVLDWQFYAIAVIRSLGIGSQCVKPHLEIAVLHNPLESGSINLIAANQNPYLS